MISSSCPQCSAGPEVADDSKCHQHLLSSSVAPCLETQALSRPSCLATQVQIRPSCAVALGWRPSCAVALGLWPSCAVALGWRPSCAVALGWRPSCAVALGWRPSCAVALAPQPGREHSWESLRSGSTWKSNPTMSPRPSWALALGWRPSGLVAWMAPPCNLLVAKGVWAITVVLCCFDRSDCWAGDTKI
uniref:Uncharacterized protein n=1 Tax=Cyprinus carpio TaxID=7962 RepID=A0A8C1TRP2_CYPCA